MTGLAPHLYYRGVARSGDSFGSAFLRKGFPLLPETLKTIENALMSDTTLTASEVTFLLHSFEEAKKSLLAGEASCQSLSSDAPEIDLFSVAHSG